MSKDLQELIIFLDKQFGETLTKHFIATALKTEREKRLKEELLNPDEV